MSRFGLGLSGAFTPLSFAYESSSSNGASQTIYTFSSAGIGAAHASRRVLVGLYATNTTALRTISSVTIGGVTATLVAATTTGVSPFTNIAFYWAQVPTGTTANIVITFSGAQLQCAYGAWAIYSAVGGVEVDASSTAAPMVLSLTPLVPNCAIFGLVRSASSPTYTWAGLSEDFDFLAGVTGVSGASAYRANAGALTITATASTSSAPCGLSVAVY